MALVFVVVVSPVTSDTLPLPLAAKSVLELETAGTCCFFSELSAVCLSADDWVSLVWGTYQYKDSKDIIQSRVQIPNSFSVPDQPQHSCTRAPWHCSRSFWYSCLLGLLAPVTRGITYVQEPLEIGRRGGMGRHLNGQYISSGQRTLAAVNGH